MPRAGVSAGLKQAGARQPLTSQRWNLPEGGAWHYLPFPDLGPMLTETRTARGPDVGGSEAADGTHGCVGWEPAHRLT